MAVSWELPLTFIPLFPALSQCGPANRGEDRRPVPVQMPASVQALSCL